MVPIINLILLGRIIITVEKEIRFETEKEKLNKSRRDERLCETRYPILLVHGVFFRDIKYFNYWGRVPKELQINGATVFYGNHASASSVASSAEELSVRIKEILRETGAEKVNIVAHSKGGLDCRYALSQLGMAPYVASLTTVNTPHKGCVFADELLTRIPIDLQTKVANAYNKTLRKLCEPQADFLAAVNDLTAKSCKEREPMMEVPAGVYCQSVGSVMPRHSGGKFPLNLSYHLVKYFDGANDGLVSVDSFRWGENFTLLTPTGKRGISHGDMIDLNRENIEGFDVREFYVSLINGLKKKGY
jgi:triacylglycerol lipase